MTTNNNNKYAITSETVSITQLFFSRVIFLLSEFIETVLVTFIGVVFVIFVDIVLVILATFFDATFVTFMISSHQLLNHISCKLL